MNWIRMAVDLEDDPEVRAMSRVLKVRLSEACGIMFRILAKLPKHARDGDLSRFDPIIIEDWCDWHGKRGALASEFFTRFCSEDRRVRSWEKHNGAAIRDADRRSSVMRERRAARERERSVTGNVTGNDGGTVTVTPALTGRDVTGRDGTNYNNKQQGDRDADAPRPTRKAKVSQSPAQFPGADKATCDALYELWLSTVGAVPYGRFKKAVGPLLTSPAERPPSRPRDDELAPAMRLYLSAIDGTPEARFRTINRCAEALTGVVKVMREHSDALKQFDAVQAFLGVTQRRAA